MAEEKIKKVRQRVDPLTNSSLTSQTKAEKPAKVKVAKEKKSIFKKKQKVENKAPEPKIQTERKKPHVSKRQRGYDEKKSKLAVKGRQTKWAPVWAVIKKHGTGKRIHPSAMTAYKRNWRRTKLHIKPRRIRKWHMG